MTTSGIDFGVVVERLRRARRVAVLTHQRPDPDALGSQTGVAMLLRRLGAERVVVVNWETVPRIYAYLQEGLAGAGIEIATFSPAWEHAEAENFDTVVAVDTCTYAQMEPAAPWLRKIREKLVAVDHHLSRDDLAAVVLADTSAPACTEIIVELAEAAGAALDRAMAVPLLSGIVADTGWFRFDSVRPATLHAAAALMAAGAEPAELYERLQQNETKPKLSLITRALESIVYAAGDRVAVMVLHQRDFAETGAAPSQTEEIVNLPLMLGSVEVVGLLTELADGRVRGSLRSKRALDVNKVAREFGGGGHAKAAGLRTQGPVEQARERLLAVIMQAMGQTAGH